MASDKNSCFVTNIATNLNGNSSDLYLLGSAQSLTTPPASLSVILPFEFVSKPVLSGGNLSVSFTTPGALDTTSSFTLQSSPNVNGPYTNDAAAIFSGSSPSFSVTVPEAGTNLFFRLHHN